MDVAPHTATLASLRDTIRELEAQVQHAEHAAESLARQNAQTERNCAQLERELADTETRVRTLEDRKSAVERDVLRLPKVTTRPARDSTHSL